MTRKQLVTIAKQEIEVWHQLPPGLVIAILFAFIHRVTTGETFEETFLKEPNKPDYEI